MSGKPKNTETVTPGSTITLDCSFFNYSGGSLTDPSPAPTYIFYDPSNTILATGTGTKVSTGYYTASYTVPLTAIISPLYKIEWTAIVNGYSVADAWEYFQVISPGSAEFGDVIIGESYLNQVKAILAYPSVSQVILTDAQIKSLCIAPAMMEYFTKFPVKESVEYSCNEETIFDFPDSYTFGVLDVRAVNKGYLPGSGSSFWDIVRFQMTSMNTRYNDTYGIRNYNPNHLRQQSIMQRQTLQSLENQFQTYKYRVDYENRKLYVYASSTAPVDITWAKWSNDFDNFVKYQFRQDVICLAQARLLWHIGDTASIVSDTNIELSINSDALKTRATELETRIRDKWAQYPDVIVLRMD